MFLICAHARGTKKGMAWFYCFTVFSSLVLVFCPKGQGDIYPRKGYMPTLNSIYFSCAKSQCNAGTLFYKNHIMIESSQNGELKIVALMLWKSAEYGDLTCK
jgi:hypothetical protein